jgi:hypothetical protein
MAQEKSDKNVFSAIVLLIKWAVIKIQIFVLEVM